MPAKTFLHGLAIAGYRSFGSDIQRMGPFAGINLFAGANNAGKSNILKFIFEKLPAFAGSENNVPSSGTIEIRPEDRSLDYSGGSCIGMAVPVDDRLWSLSPSVPDWTRPAFAKQLSTPDFSFANGLAWFDYKERNHERVFELSQSHDTALSRVDERPLVDTWKNITKRTGGDRLAWAQDIARYLTPKSRKLPSIWFVPAVREITVTADSPGNVLNGRGLITRLAQLSQRSPNDKPTQRLFESILEFVRSVVVDPTAEISVPFSRDTVSVRLHGVEQPLLSLGTGIHEVIMLAIACTSVENAIVCLEEPETHLHPVLQRRLIEYLSNNTTNQYFIATHSAHLLDTEGAAVFHVRQRDKVSVVDVVQKPGDRFAICRDLGYRASDIVQANCVIWVEGPSDRIYINKWLSEASQYMLIEGIHYSLMFYGGKLLSHLSAEDDAVAGFIELRRLNRHMSIVMDSDKADASTKVGDTKLRIEQEFKKGGGVAWLTIVRTIENYIPQATFETAWKIVHPKTAVPTQSGQYARFVSNVGDKETFDKIKLAREICAHPAELGEFDLKDRVEELAQFIRVSNADLAQ